VPFVDPLARVRVITDIEHRSQAAADEAVDGLTAADIAFDNSGGSLVASNVQSAIDELESLSGGGSGSGGFVEPFLLMGA